jgi:hypothetical protein
MTATAPNYELYRFRRLAAPPLQPYGSSRPVRGTGRAELSGFGKARNVNRIPERVPVSKQSEFVTLRIAWTVC